MHSYLVPDVGERALKDHSSWSAFPQIGQLRAQMRGHSGAQRVAPHHDRIGCDIGNVFEHHQGVAHHALLRWRHWIGVCIASVVEGEHMVVEVSQQLVNLRPMTAAPRGRVPVEIEDDSAAGHAQQALVEELLVFGHHCGEFGANNRRQLPQLLLASTNPRCSILRLQRRLLRHLLLHAEFPLEAMHSVAWQDVPHTDSHSVLVLIVILDGEVKVPRGVQSNGLRLGEIKALGVPYCKGGEGF